MDERLHGVEIGTLRRDEIPLAAGVAARGMCDNPLSISLFGDDPVRRVRGLETTFHGILATLERPALVARRLGYVVAIAALSPPDRCFFRQTVEREKVVQIGGKRVGLGLPDIPLHLLLPVVRLGPGALARLSATGEAGIKHDPPERHQHVELVAVEAGLRGLGIGTLLMKALCPEMDEIGVLSYLETDTRQNVRWYETFGFRVSDEATVLDTQIWYMRREPAVATDVKTAD